MNKAISAIKGIVPDNVLCHVIAANKKYPSVYIALIGPKSERDDKGGAIISRAIADRISSAYDYSAKIVHPLGTWVIVVFGEKSEHVFKMYQDVSRWKLGGET